MDMDTDESEVKPTSSSHVDNVPETEAENNVMEMDNAMSVLHKIAHLYAEQLMSDICLVVGKNRYPAHRVILCASSEVFQVMLMNPEWNECKKSVIELKEDPLCSEVFPQFLKYLYVGQIRISLQTVMPMLVLADKYNIKDLVQLCVDYILKHVAIAATQGYLIAWLQYSINFSPYHQEVTLACQKFLKWNLDLVADSVDFGDLDVNVLELLLQQNDLVLRSEYDLFLYVERWLLHKRTQLDVPNDPDGLATLQQYIEATVMHVRFPMLTTLDLANLLLRPIVQYHKAFFVGRVSIGLSYHAGKEDHVTEVRATERDRLQFTPRLYTTDTCCLSLTVSEFQLIEDYQNFVAYLFATSNMSESQGEEQQVTWEVDFFPRGIRYSRAKVINVSNYQGGVEIPESVLRTVRLRVTCKDNLVGEHKYKIGVLITGVQNEIAHVRTVHERTSYFSKQNRVLNIDHLLPYGELEMSSIMLSPHLIGDNRNTLRIQVVIIPMSRFVCHEVPLFEFK